LSRAQGTDSDFVPGFKKMISPKEKDRLIKKYTKTKQGWRTLCLSLKAPLHARVQFAPLYAERSKQPSRGFGTKEWVVILGRSSEKIDQAMKSLVNEISSTVTGTILSLDIQLLRVLVRGAEVSVVVTWN
jgi:hypothetical protein